MRSAPYIVAVSGGVDSVVLLDIMTRRTPDAGQRLVVAHFDHGIRDDSSDDRLFVEALARSYGLQFVYHEGRLGEGAAEHTAREARYAFLRRVRHERNAGHIITAHHQDDVLETAIINLLRGTGRKGLSALRSHGDLYRPLLPTPKKHIVAYAHRNGLRWREDSTNASTEYLRNYVRQHIMTRLDSDGRQRLRQIVEQATSHNMEIDALLDRELQGQLASGALDRQWFIMLPYNVSREMMAAWLRQSGVADFDRKTVERLTVVAKTGKSGKQIDISKGRVMVLSNDELRISFKQ